MDWVSIRARHLHSRVIDSLPLSSRTRREGCTEGPSARKRSIGLSCRLWRWGDIGIWITMPWYGQYTYWFCCVSGYGKGAGLLGSCLAAEDEVLWLWLAVLLDVPALLDVFDARWPLPEGLPWLVVPWVLSRECAARLLSIEPVSGVEWRCRANV